MRGASLFLLCLLLPLSVAAQPVPVTCQPTHVTTAVVSWQHPPPDPHTPPHWRHTGYTLERLSSPPTRVVSPGPPPTMRMARAAPAVGTVIMLDAEARTYTDKGLAEGHHEYKLRAVHTDPDGQEFPSAYAASDPEDPPCVVVVGPPPPPGDLTVRPPSP